MELDHMMYVGKHPNIIELIGVCSIKGLLSCHLDTFFFTMINIQNYEGTYRNSSKFESKIVL